MNAIAERIERAKAIAAERRGYAEGKGRVPPVQASSAGEKEEVGPKGSGYPPRELWRVYWPQGFGVWPIYVDVLVRPPQTRLEMRALYPRSDMVAIEAL